LKFRVKFVRSAEEDLVYYTRQVQRAIFTAILNFLETDANVETKI